MSQNDNQGPRWPGEITDRRILADAYARVDRAKNDMGKLETAAGDFIWETIKIMVTRRSSDTNVTVHLPPAAIAHEGRVPTEVRSLCASVIENLRAALDYGIVTLAKTAKPDLTQDEERRIGFLIARNESGFQSRAPAELKYIGNDLRDGIEKLQPYNGNQVLEFLLDVGNSSKHRRLPKVELAVNPTIVFSDYRVDNNWEAEGWTVFPAAPGHVFLARVNQAVLKIRDKHDALVVFPICIEHVEGIINSLEFYAQHGHLPPSA